MAKQSYVWDGTQFVSMNVPIGAVPNAVGAYSSTAPSNPTAGQIWYDVAASSLKMWSGSTWVVTATPINLSNYVGAVSITGNTSITGSVSLVGTTTARDLVPSATNAYDLGTTSARWRNIYTQDLHLSNGIGDYTVVEGEENLYVTNNKTGKAYKFALIEVDPSEVPQKSEE